MTIPPRITTSPKPMPHRARNSSLNFVVPKLFMPGSHCTVLRRSQSFARLLGRQGEVQPWTAVDYSAAAGESWVATPRLYHRAVADRPAGASEPRWIAVKSRAPCRWTDRLLWRKRPFGRFLVWIFLPVPPLDPGRRPLASTSRMGRGAIMKKDIHPKYFVTTVTCGCGNTFTTRSTRPELKVDICNVCHPFYTGKLKYVDTAGRIEKFQKKFAATGYASLNRGKKAGRAQAES